MIQWLEKITWNRTAFSVMMAAWASVNVRLLHPGNLGAQYIAYLSTVAFLIWLGTVVE